MPIITIVIVVNSRQDKTRQDKRKYIMTTTITHKDNHYSMNSDGMKIISYLIISNMRKYNRSNTILNLPTFEVICTSHKKEHIFIYIYMCVWVCVGVCPCMCV